MSVAGTLRPWQDRAKMGGLAQEGPWNSKSAAPDAERPELGRLTSGRGEKEEPSHVQGEKAPESGWGGASHSSTI